MKKHLIKLAESLHFISKKKAIIFKNHTNLDYYLWLCELQKWLRDQCDIHTDVQNVNAPTKGKWMFEIMKLPCGVLVLWDKDTSPVFNTYEKALEKGLFEALKLYRNIIYGKLKIK